MSEVRAQITGNVWKVLVESGQTVSAGDTLVILESMKMEIPVEAEDSGVVLQLDVKEGQSVNEGDLICRLSR